METPNSQKPFHSRHQIGSGRFHHHVEMIGHQTQGMCLPARLATGLAQGFKEQVPVLVPQENGFPPIPTIHHMVNGPGIFQAQLSRHSGRVWSERENMSIVISDPFQQAVQINPHPYAKLVQPQSVGLG